jgi:hypothetical protein
MFLRLTHYNPLPLYFSTVLRQRRHCSKEPALRVLAPVLFFLRLGHQGNLPAFAVLFAWNEFERDFVFPFGEDGLVSEQAQATSRVLGQVGGVFLTFQPLAGGGDGISLQLNFLRPVFWTGFFISLGRENVPRFPRELCINNRSIELVIIEHLY